MSSSRPTHDAAYKLDELLSQPASAQTGEYRVLTFRRHARHLLWSAVIFIALSGIIPFYAGTFIEPWQNWMVVGGGIAVAFVLVIVPFFTWLARTTTVSTRRIIMRSGVITRHRSELPLTQIRELKLKRGPIQRMFGAGDIVLQTEMSDPHVLKNVPRVKPIAQAIQELIEWQYASQQFAQQQRPAGAPSFASGL